MLASMAVVGFYRSCRLIPKGKIILLASVFRGKQRFRYGCGNWSGDEGYGGFSEELFGRGAPGQKGKDYARATRKLEETDRIVATSVRERNWKVKACKPWKTGNECTTYFSLKFQKPRVFVHPAHGVHQGSRFCIGK